MTEIDAERQRFLVSLKPSECFPERYSGGYDVVSGVELLENFLSERQKIALQLAASSGISQLERLRPSPNVELELFMRGPNLVSEVHEKFDVLLSYVLVNAFAWIVQHVLSV